MPKTERTLRGMFVYIFPSAASMQSGDEAKESAPLPASTAPAARAADWAESPFVASRPVRLRVSVRRVCRAPKIPQ